MARVTSGDVGIEYASSGEGPAVLLLHGFPDTGACWRHQVPALTAAGFRVLVPDLRGYGRSDKPTDVDAYGLLHLAGDAMAVLDDAGVDRAHVVGHDWGAAVAWALGMFAPERVDHLAVLSVGYPSTFLRTLEQREKSWYMLLFQFEGVAEEWLRADDWANFRAWSHHPDADAVVAALEANGSLTPALNYYRANLSPPTWAAPRPALPTVAAPTLGLWSTGDMALTEAQMTDSAQGVAGTFRYERLEGPGHWLQLEAPDEVNRLLVEFLSS